jgi:hypothetical protein
VLGAGRPQQLGRLAVELDDRANVHGEPQVDVLGLLVAGRRADADAGVVDEDVEAPEPLAVPRNDGGDRVGVCEVRRHRLDVGAVLRNRSAAASSVSGLRALMVTPWPLGRERLREREPDAAAGSGDDGGALRQSRNLVRRGRARTRCGARRRETRPRCDAGTALAPGPGQKNYDMTSVR